MQRQRNDRVNKVGSILQILPQGSPGRDGVADYARTLAGRLEQHHGLTTIFVSTAGGHRLVFPRMRTGEKKSDRYAAIVLHYVNYGYSRKGVPLWLPPTLRRLQQMSGARQITVFHELYASDRGGKARSGCDRSRCESLALSRPFPMFASSAAKWLVNNSRASRQSSRFSVTPSSPTLESQLSSAEITQRDPHRWIICGGTELVERSLRSFLTGRFLYPGAIRSARSLRCWWE